ncbi:hypothetical protein DFH27DRAFT_277491 [Peziza echinospora]|nr:hypothetical protein DFH27DRAFT_277491 [Peziza echinospora]
MRILLFRVSDLSLFVFSFLQLIFFFHISGYLYRFLFFRPFSVLVFFRSILLSVSILSFFSFISLHQNKLTGSYKLTIWPLAIRITFINHRPLYKHNQERYSKKIQIYWLMTELLHIYRGVAFLFSFIFFSFEKLNGSDRAPQLCYFWR